MSSTGQYSINKLRKSVAGMFCPLAPPSNPAVSESSATGELPPLHVYPTPVVVSGFVKVFGVDSTSRCALHVLDDTTALCFGGNLLFFYNYITGELNDVQEGAKDSSVGAIAVHPLRELYAVCEKSWEAPRVLLRTYPGGEVQHILRGGAVRGYGACAFNFTGSLLATAAVEPDYMLTLWDWVHESCVLRSKSFSADVYSLYFSAFSQTLLVSSGSGYIKFWSMVNTFTGRKLQGQVGKFGRLELSDIASSVALPDGKVISSSEHGSLLLWEGGLIKCEIFSLLGAGDAAGDTAEPSTAASLARRSGMSTEKEERESSSSSATIGMRKAVSFHKETPQQSRLPQQKTQVSEHGQTMNPCHVGAIDIVVLVEEGEFVMTVGSDGYVRYWPTRAIDLAEPPGPFSITVGVPLLRQLFLGVGIRGRSVSLSVDGTMWVLLDSGGSLLTFPRWRRDQLISEMPRSFNEHDNVTVVNSFFGGAVAACAFSPCDALVVCGGEDGTVRAITQDKFVETSRLRFNAAVTCLEFLSWTRPIAEPPSAGEDPPSVEQSGSLRASFLLCGFGDGSLRYLSLLPSEGLGVVAAWRPHEVGICTMALDASERQLYTASSDFTLFYFRLSSPRGLSQDITPIGSCRLPTRTREICNGNPALAEIQFPTPPLCSEWTAEGDACLFGFDSGVILGVRPPDAHVPLADFGYEFTIDFFGVALRQRRLPAKRPPKILPNGQIEEEEPENDEEQDVGPWAVTCIRRLPNAKASHPRYVLCFKKDELCYIYSCCVRYDGMIGPPPVPPTGVDPTGRVEEPQENLCYRDCVPFRCTFSTIAGVVAVSCERGIVILRRLGALDNQFAQVCVIHTAHDSVTGRILGCTIAPDGTSIITTGTDGLVLTSRVELEGLSRRAAAARARAVARTPETADAQLALRRTAPGETLVQPLIEHSIAEQKAIDDRTESEQVALGRRERILHRIAAVHGQYMELLNENAAAPVGWRLNSQELVLDPALCALTVQERDRVIDKVREEFSWRLAYKGELVNQLRRGLLDTYNGTFFLVRSCNHDCVVPSVCSAVLSDSLLARMYNIEQAASAAGEAAAGEERVTLSPDKRAAQTAGDTVSGDDEVNVEGGCSPGSVGASQNSLSVTNSPTNCNPQLMDRLAKADKRRRERAKMKRLEETILARRPRTTDTDASGIAMIADTRSNLGDHVLRRAPEYIPPDNLAPSAEKRSMELTMLLVSISRMADRFNKKLLLARQRKRVLCTRLAALRKRLIAVVTTLQGNLDEVPPAITLAPDEEPEKAYLPTDDVLRAFDHDRIIERQRVAAEQRSRRGFGGDLADTPLNTRGSVTSSCGGVKGGSLSGVRASIDEGRASRAGVGGSLPPHSGTVSRDPALEARLANARVEELEEEEQQMVQALLGHERAQLLHEICNSVTTFDDSLRLLAAERGRLEADIRAAHLRALLLYREYRMLLAFQGTDDSLKESINLCETKKCAVMARAEELNVKVTAAAERHKMNAAALATLAETAERVIQQGCPEHDQPYLRRVFKRKVKRWRHGEGDEGANDDAPTSTDEDDEDEDENFEEECPDACEEDTWTRVLELRERRLDCEDVEEDLRAETKKLSIALKQAAKEDETVAAEHALLKEQYAVFQAEKHRQLNKLDITIPLHLSQIQCILEPEMRIPRQLAEEVVINERELARLRGRIVQNEKDKAALREGFTELRRQKMTVAARRSAVQLEKNEWDARVTEMMLLKFGQKVDLDAVEKASIDREAEKLKVKLAQERAQWERDVRHIEQSVANIRTLQHLRFGENTSLLKDLATLREKQAHLERSLNQAPRRVLETMGTASIAASRAARAHLNEEVVSQQQEIDALEAEIMMLRRKGGHLISPVMTEFGTAAGDARASYTHATEHPETTPQVGYDSEMPDSGYGSDKPSYDSFVQ